MAEQEINMFEGKLERMNESIKKMWVHALYWVEFKNFHRQSWTRLIDKSVDKYIIFSA